MIAWFQVLGVVLLGVGSFFVGRWLAKQSRAVWGISIGVSLGAIAVITVGRFFPELRFAAPTSWLTAGRREFVCSVVIIPILFCILSSRLPQSNQRRLVGVFTVLAVVFYGLAPFLLPLILSPRFAASETIIDTNGVCLQTTGYTCGPAAGVTALHHLGLPAEEGQLAIAAHTTFKDGTHEDWLCSALTTEYGKMVRPEFKVYQSIEQLREDGLTIVLVRLNTFTDHYVTVFDVSDDGVLIGDPMSGLEYWSHDRFLRKWRKRGIVIHLAYEEPGGMLGDARVGGGRGCPSP